MVVVVMLASEKPVLLVLLASCSLALFAAPGEAPAPLKPHASAATDPGQGKHRAQAAAVKGALPEGSGSCGLAADMNVPPARETALLAAPNASEVKPTAVLLEKSSGEPEVSMAAGSNHVHSGATLASATV